MGWPSQVGRCTPLVMLTIGRSATLPHETPAVSAWSRLTALAAWVRRRLNAVMSNWSAAPSSMPRPIWSRRSTGKPAPSQSGAADPEDELLVQAHLAPADVEDARDRAVRWGVVRDVGVEQKERHAPDLRDPHRRPDRPPGQLHRHAQPTAVRSGDLVEGELGR